MVEGDVTQSGLGLTAETARRLQKNLDLVINSSGLTDFNPDLRDALSTNTDAAPNILEFVRSTDHTGLLHLSTCYVAGEQDGRVSERLIPDYNPRGLAGFDAEQEWRSLQEFVKQAEVQAESEEVTSGLRIAGAVEGTRGERPARGGAGESDSQGPSPLAEDISDRSGDAARQRTGLAEHLHAHQESG